MYRRSRCLHHNNLANILKFLYPEAFGAWRYSMFIDYYGYCLVLYEPRIPSGIGIFNMGPVTMTHNSVWKHSKDIREDESHNVKEPKNPNQESEEYSASIKQIISPILFSLVYSTEYLILVIFCLISISFFVKIKNSWL